MWGGSTGGGAECVPPLRSTGCVRQLRIQNEEVAFGELDLQAHGVSNCPTCQDQPCQVRLEMMHTVPFHWSCSWCLSVSPPHRTVASARTRRAAPTSAAVPRASPAATASTHRPCIATQVGACTTGTSPAALWVQGSPVLISCLYLLCLWAEACGPDATCISRPDGHGYSCRCHLGKMGERCTEGGHSRGGAWGGNARDRGVGLGPSWGCAWRGDQPGDRGMGGRGITLRTQTWERG